MTLLSAAKLQIKPETNDIISKKSYLKYEISNTIYII